MVSSSNVFRNDNPGSRTDVATALIASSVRVDLGRPTGFWLSVELVVLKLSDPRPNCAFTRISLKHVI